MPIIFLSPSTQEYNPYVDGGNEEYYMNLIADAMIPYLNASGIEYVRNDPSKTVSNSIAQSNAGVYNFHLAIHSNASPQQTAGQNRGVQIYYYPNSSQSTRAAEIFAENYKKIYPDPNLVKTVPTTTLAEIVRTTAPAILIETAYHDNKEDARWIRENIGEIAANLSESTAEFLGVPFRTPSNVRTGTVTTQSTALNLREQPSTNSQILAKIPKGAKIPIIGTDGNWYLTRYNGIQGYVSSDYVTL
ncbi:MAG: N-acetylmuramoyl-L-alanine amidase [Clostridia bacterium]|nr:N-acetylmuramoyl-L-alanine amidase [Clostridia bacterium]